MKKHFVIKLFLLVVLFGINQKTFGQIDSLKSGYYTFVLVDSSTVNGYIVFEDNEVIQLKLLNGTDMRFKKNLIVSKKYVENKSNIVIKFELKGGSILIGKIITEASPWPTFK